MNAVKKREGYYDFLRGIAIIFVVGIHTVNTNVDYGSYSGFLTVLCRQLIACAVPIFLTISGYFLVRKSTSTRKDYFSFLKHQIPVVYLPCLLWSLPYMAMSLKGGASVVYSVLYLLLCGYSIYYFIACIIQCYIFLPLVKKCGLGVILILLMISVVWGLGHVKFNLIPGTGLPLLLYAAPFPNLLVFFALGCWLGSDKRNYSLGLIGVLFILSLGLNIWESYYLQNTFHVYGMGMKTSSHLLDFFAVLLLFHPKVKGMYRDNRVTSWINKLGVASFAIYLSHLLIGMILFRVGFLNSFWLVKWISLLLVSWIFVEVAKKILPEKSWRFLGLR